MKKRQRMSDRDMDRIKARMNLGVMDSFATGEVD
jgi:hypothetical protein